jgi:hypothetical protein
MSEGTVRTQLVLRLLTFTKTFTRKTCASAEIQRRNPWAPAGAALGSPSKRGVCRPASRSPKQLMRRDNRTDAMELNTGVVKATLSKPPEMLRRFDVAERAMQGQVWAAQTWSLRISSESARIAGSINSSRPKLIDVKLEYLIHGHMHTRTHARTQARTHARAHPYTHR